MKKKLFAVLIIAVLACTFIVPTYAVPTQTVFLPPTRSWSIVPTYAVPTQAATAKTGIYKVHNQNRYYKKGKFKKVTGLVKDVRHKKWVYVKKGIFKKVTGVVPKYGSKKEYYVKKGVLNKATGLAKNLATGKLVYVEKGVLNKSHSGCVKSLIDNKYYYVRKGKFTKYTGYSTDEKGHIMQVVKGVAKTHKHKWGPHKYIDHYDEINNNLIVTAWVCYCGEKFSTHEEYSEHNHLMFHGGCRYEMELNPNYKLIPVYANTPDVLVCSECGMELRFPPTYTYTSAYFEESDGALWLYSLSKPNLGGDGAARSGKTVAEITDPYNQIKNNNW